MTDPTSPMAETRIHARVIAADPVKVKERPTRNHRALWKHPAGPPLLWAAAVVTALGFAPLILQRLEIDIVRVAAGIATNIAPPWPSGTDPTLWPPTVATGAWFTGALVIVVAVAGVKVPNIVPLLLAGALTATTAFAVWSTFDVINTESWFLVPLSVLAFFAFAMAGRALLRWKSTAFGSTSGSPIPSVLFAWVLTLGVIVAGTAIVTESLKSAGNGVQTASSTPQTLDGLRADGATTLDTMRGTWVPQVASAEIHDQAGADAYLAKHQEWMTRYPVIIVRGGDFPTGTLSAEDWMTLVTNAFGSEAEVQAWCSSNGLGTNDCVPRQIPG